MRFQDAAFPVALAERGWNVEPVQRLDHGASHAPGRLRDIAGHGQHRDAGPVLEFEQGVLAFLIRGEGAR